ncbi:MAG: hypothetical protein BWX68_02048 [Verrucomicrobia bacterium ADurb.Bin063]|nr:MAG: hypothetical protein BWX68_02048 [Verrucomicrobia bacterium ADurb.Bin063]
MITNLLNLTDTTPFRFEVLEDDFDGFDQERRGASRDVEDHHKELVRRQGHLHPLRLAHLGHPDLRQPQIRPPLEHVRPRHRGSQPILDVEFLLQEFVDAAHDVGHHRLRRVEDAALNLLSPVVGRQEVFVEVDDRVFIAGTVAEVSFDGVRIGLVQQLDHVLDAQLVEVESFLPACQREERGQQFPEEGVGLRHHIHQVLRRNRRPGEPRDQQPVGDGLRDDIRKVILRQIMNEGGAKRRAQLPERPVL